MHTNAMSVMENVSVATNYSGCYQEDDEKRRPFVFFYLSLIVIAIPSNSFSLYVSWQHIRQGNELGVYLFNLALTDLMFTIGLSLWMDFLWRGAWVHGGFVCVLSVYLLFTNFYTTDAFLCCIAVDRYLAVAHPLKFPFLRKIGTAAVTSVAIWVLVLSFNAATITLEDSYDESNTVPMCFEVHPLTDEQTFNKVNVVRFVVGFICPSLLVAYCSRGICVAVKSNRATEEKERKRVSRLLGVVLLSLGLCFGPVHVMLLLHGLLDHCKNPGWLLHKISIAISSLNCLVDPLLYCFITRAGKANITQVVQFIQGKKRVKGQAVV